jgi:hypothetical protein
MSVTVTGADLVEFVRMQIREAYAKTWTPANIIMALNAAKGVLMTWIKGIQGSDEYFYTNCTIPIVAGTQTYTLPNGSLYSSADKCSGHVDFLVDKSNTSIPRVVWPGDFRAFHDGLSGATIERFAIKHKTLWIYPTTTNSFDADLYYFYIPADIADNATEVDFIEGCEYAIALQAIVTSKINVQEDIDDVERQLDFYKEAIRLQVASRIQCRAQRVPDESDIDVTEDEDYE